MHLYLLPSKITPLKNIREIVSFCEYRIKLFTLDAKTNETGKDIVTVFIGQVGVALFWTVVVFICWGISLTYAYIQS